MTDLIQRVKVQLRSHKNRTLLSAAAAVLITTLTLGAGLQMALTSQDVRSDASSQNSNLYKALDCPGPDTRRSQCPVDCAFEERGRKSCGEALNFDDPKSICGTGTFGHCRYVSPAREECEQNALVEYEEVTETKTTYCSQPIGPRPRVPCTGRSTEENNGISNCTHLNPFTPTGCVVSTNETSTESRVARNCTLDECKTGQPNLEPGQSLQSNTCRLKRGAPAQCIEATSEPVGICYQRVCKPGEVLGCWGFYSEEVCNDRGTQYIKVDCAFDESTGKKFRCDRQKGRCSGSDSTDSNSTTTTTPNTSQQAPTPTQLAPTQPAPTATWQCTPDKCGGRGCVQDANRCCTPTDQERNVAGCTPKGGSAPTQPAPTQPASAPAPTGNCVGGCANCPWGCSTTANCVQNPAAPGTYYCR